MLWCAFVRSPLARARILGIDASQALRAPGVQAVITGRDIPPKLCGRRLQNMPVLAVDRLPGQRGEPRLDELPKRSYPEQHDNDDRGHDQAVLDRVLRTPCSHRSSAQCGDERLRHVLTRQSDALLRQL